MPTGRTVSKHVPQHHYALLLISPLSSQTDALQIDEPTLLQILQKQLTEWFGTAGGVNSNEVDIVEIQQSPSTPLEEDSKDAGDREVILRFPRSITPQLLTALPLLNSSTYRIRVLNDSSDLSRFVGFAGRGKTGFNDWKTQLLNQSPLPRQESLTSLRYSTFASFVSSSRLRPHVPSAPQPTPRCFAVDAFDRSVLPRIRLSVNIWSTKKYQQTPAHWKQTARPDQALDRLRPRPGRGKNRRSNKGTLG